MDYPYYKYNRKKKELTIYWDEYRYVTYYDEDAELLHKDLESARDEDLRFIYNELHLDMEHEDPYRRSE